MAKTNDGMLRYQIGKKVEKLEELGIEVPGYDEGTPLEEVFQTLKQLVEQHTPTGSAKPTVSKLTKLQQEADKVGAYYEPDWTEDQLEASVKETKETIAKKKAEDKLIEKTAEATPTPAGMDMEAFARVLGEQISKGISSVGKDAQSRLTSDRTYDPKDQVEGKTYFVPMIYWKLPAKRVGGQQVMAPFGKIEFKLLHGSAVKTGDQWSTRYLSAYYTESKREQDHLETHPLFSKVFFLSDTEARVSSEQVKFAQKFSRHMESLMTHQAPALYNMAPGLGIRLDTSMSLVAIRNLIAEALTANDMKADREHMQSLIEQGQRATLLASTAT
jgi:hypothetical protein